MKVDFIRYKQECIDLCDKLQSMMKEDEELFREAVSDRVLKAVMEANSKMRADVKRIKNEILNLQPSDGM